MIQNRGKISRASVGLVTGTMVTDETLHAVDIDTTDLASSLAGTAATTGLDNAAGVMSVVYKLAHQVADEKLLFFSTYEIDIGASAGAVDTKIVDSLEAKGQLVGAIGILTEVFNGDADTTISISKTASAGTKMSSDVVVAKTGTAIGNVIGFAPVSGANSIQSSAGDVYIYATASTSRTTGIARFILLWQKVT